MTTRLPEYFHSIIRNWFDTAIGVPTEVQSAAWPVIRGGDHVLITAPTGSGKTLAAFLWGIHRFVSGELDTGATRILYVSPLKALNNDVKRNLIRPLSELSESFKKTGTAFPEIRVATRSGDTSSGERRKMGRFPPEILITTPESLNLLVTSKSGRRMLSTVETVILDEIHAVIGNKRGTHLITAVERLGLLAGEFQRIGLSATIRPLATASDFIGGFLPLEDGGYIKRKVIPVNSRERKMLDVGVVFPEIPEDVPVNESRWPVFAGYLKGIVERNRSSLLFVTSRRTAEKAARLLNGEMGSESVYAHHGSLSREIRETVEQKFKNGEFSAIVATNSLELGIDIGELETVVLIGPNCPVASALQRIGRSGHGVGQTARGILFPTHGKNFIESAVLAESILQNEIEAVQPVECPLDVLAQVILAMTGTNTWNRDELYRFIRTSWPYRNLEKRLFDKVIEMLAGKYALTRIRELHPRIVVDEIEHTIKAKSGALLQVYMGGGTIPDRGYFELRHMETGAKIGELDEEFVWERRVGESFALGVQAWTIRKISHNAVEVTHAKSGETMIPFWKGEPMDRDFFLSQKIGKFLEQADERLDDPAFADLLHERYRMDAIAARELVLFLKSQKEATRASLPHRRHVLVEHFDDPFNLADGKQVIIHTMWGGRVNRPFALAISAAWEDRFGYPLEVYPENDAVLLILPHEFHSEDLLFFPDSANIETLIRKKLETTGFFGARFRENAGRALLLPKQNFKKRMPLWLNRLRSKKLLESVKSFRDFPILLETWRTCLQDAFDMKHLGMVLDELKQGTIRISETITTHPSPFAGSLIFQQTNQHMYEDDTPKGGGVSSLGDDLIREAAFSSRLRPKIPDRVRNELVEKLHRTAPGYAPDSPEGIIEWVKERLYIPEDEWNVLMGGIYRETSFHLSDMPVEQLALLVRVRPAGATFFSVCAVETLPILTAAFRVTLAELSVEPLVSASSELSRRIGKNTRKIFEQFRSDRERNHAGDDIPENILSDVLQRRFSFDGPILPERLVDETGLSLEILEEGVRELVESGIVIRDCFREENGPEELCDRENLERLLRMTKSFRKPVLEPRKIDEFPLFLSVLQGLTAPGNTLDDFTNRMETLFGYPAPVDAWETQIFPARMSGYRQEMLDQLMRETDLCWFGCGNRTSSFSFTEDLELFLDRTSSGKTPDLPDIFPSIHGKYSFFELMTHSGFHSKKLTEIIWENAWKGLLSNDGFEAVRKGIYNRFAPFGDYRGVKLNRKRGRAHFNRWKSSRPVTGGWYLLSFDEDETDPIYREELLMDRARQLLRRYGVVFREIMQKELPEFSWSNLLRTLRRMELSGEIFTGRFFESVQGLQFVSTEALKILETPLPEDAIFWMSAVDPASPCGLNIPGFDRRFPSRIASNHMVFKGSELKLVSRKNGKDITLFTTIDDNDLPGYLSMFRAFLDRPFQPLKSVIVERINGKPAIKSPFIEPLIAFGFETDDRFPELRRQF